MRKHTAILVLITCVMLLTACGPSEKAIQEAIEKTQTAKDLVTTQTAPTPTPTEVATPTEVPIPTEEPTPTVAPMTYAQAVQKFKEGNFEEAIVYFSNNLQVENSAEYLRKSEVMMGAQGGWINREYGLSKMIVSGWDVRWQLFQSFNWWKEFEERSFTIQPVNVTEDGFSVNYQGFFDIIYEKEGGVTLVAKYSEGKYSRSDNAPLYFPDIGMTTQQVLDSCYGKPDEINTTRTATTTSEQWVYREYEAYVYLENGIVTAIQN